MVSLDIIDLARSVVDGGVEKRKCKSCNVCCTVLGVESMGKPCSTHCEHEMRDGSCRIYTSRPEDCQNYYCLYRMGWGVDPKDRPDLNGLLLSIHESDLVPGKTLVLEVIEIKPGAFLSRFPKGENLELFSIIREYKELCHLLIIPYGVYRTDRFDARPPYTQPFPKEYQDCFVGNNMCLVQMGVRDLEGRVITQSGSISQEEYEKELLKGLGVDSRSRERGA